MANKFFRLGILVMIFGMIVIGCDNGTTSGDGGGGGKVLVIQNIPNSILSADQYGEIGLFNVGTTLTQAQSLTGFVAGAYVYNDDVNVITSGSTSTVSIPLYNIDETRWSGSGTYDIYVQVNDYSGTIYKASSINFSTGTTTVPFSNVIKVR
jgi:hypothetical protein